MRTDGDSPPLKACPEQSRSACPELAEGVRGVRGVTNETVVRGFSLVRHDPEGSHYEIWSAAAWQTIPLLGSEGPGEL